MAVAISSTALAFLERATNATEPANCVTRVNNKDFWNAQAGDKDTDTGYQLFFRDIEINEIDAHLKQVTPRVDYALDAGCGNGHVLAELAKRNKKTVFCGIDFSEKMVENARVVASPCIVNVADFRSLPYPAGTFDFIYTVRGLINLPDDEQQILALKEFKRVLKPYGELSLMEMNQEGYNQTNAFLKRLGLNELPFRWHNHFFSPVVEKFMAENWFMERRFFPVTSMVKYMVQSIVKDKPKTYQAKNNELTQVLGRGLHALDFIDKDKPFGFHCHYKLWNTD